MALSLISAGQDHQRRVDAHFQDTYTHWSDVYRCRDLGSMRYQERKDAVLAMADSLHLPPGSRVLEVGCGAGLTTVALAQRGYHVQAIDTVREMIVQTRQSASECGVTERVRVSVADVHSLTFQDNFFDLVLAIGVLPWMDSPIQPLREMLRVAKPGAHLVLSFANRWRLNHVLDPFCFPPLRPLRRKTRSFLEWLGLCSPTVTPRHSYCSLREIDVMLSQVHAQKIRAMTLGFGPFTFLNYRLFSESTSIKIHHQLQALANQGTIGLRSAGAGCIVLARKADASSRNAGRN